MEGIRLNQSYTYEELTVLIKQLQNSYQGLISTRVIGVSHDSREIHLLKVGKGREMLICSAGVHGRETVNPVVILKMIEEYCEAFVQNRKIEQYEIWELLNKYSIGFIPLLNPDGYEIAAGGFDKIQNPILRHMDRMMNVLPKNWKYNGRGVDINRNFPSKTYSQQRPTEFPGSEHETRALIEIFKEYTTIGYLDFHSRGKIIYYYRSAMPLRYNWKQKKIAKSFQKLSGYSLGKKEEELDANLSGGNTVHYYSEYYGKPAITIETVREEAELPLEADLQADSFKEVHLLPLNYLCLHCADSGDKTGLRK